MNADRSSFAMPSALPAQLRAAQRFIDDNGAIELVKFLVYRNITRHARAAFGTIAQRRIEKAVDRRPGGVIVMVATLDWNYRYRQRPQHLARALARLGRTVVYVTPGHGHDRPLSCAEPEPGNLVTPHLDAALSLPGTPTVYVSSTNVRHLGQVYDIVARKGGHLVYDYLDHLDSAISNAPVTKEFRDIHAKVLGDEKHCTVLATAEVLEREVAGMRSVGFALVTNGVEPSHFAVGRDGGRLAPELARIVARGKPIIGFFGVLASWVDLELVGDAALARPGFEFVMMGPPGDADPAGLKTIPQNLNILGAVPYEDLPASAAFFDCLIVPFKLNDITRATSPLKLFEYMALGRPIVSTPIKECLKYDCVLTAGDAESFAARLDDALALASDKHYLAALKTCAHANSWQQKAQDILALLKTSRSSR